ncbi:MAG TPA: hypothetical protein V6C95_04065 [Coleofasciculaceae cyanobacterium]
MTTGSHGFAVLSAERLRPAIKDNPSHVEREIDINLRKAGCCLWTLSKTKPSTHLEEASADETGNSKDEQDRPCVVELEAPTSAKQVGVLHWYSRK